VLHGLDDGTTLASQWEALTLVGSIEPNEQATVAALRSAEVAAMESIDFENPTKSN
jgi:hypothetical protein